MNGPIIVGLTDMIALAGVAASLLAILVAVWCVDLSLKSTLRVTTLIGIRDDVVKTLDKIEGLLREVGDNSPLTSALMQKVSNDYWEAKHQFEASYQKASVILSPTQIAPWSQGVPKVVAAYARFADSYHNHILDSPALNDFKAELYVALANLERIISRRLLHFYQRGLADQLFETRQQVERRIRETNQK